MVEGVRGGLSGRRSRLLVAGEAVVQDRGRPVRPGGRHALPSAPLDRARYRRGRLGFVPLQRPEPQQGVGRETAPGRGRHAVDLGGERGGPREVARPHGGHPQVRESERQGGKRAGVADDLDLSGSDRVQASGSHTARAGARCHPAPTQDVFRGHVGERLDCPLQRRSRGGVAFGDQQRETVEQEVERTRTRPAAGGPARRGRSPGGRSRAAGSAASSAAPQAVR